MIGLKKNTLCTTLNKGAHKLHRFQQFLRKRSIKCNGRLNYQLILNLRFKGRGAIFLKINIFMLKKDERTPERTFQKRILNNFSRRIT